MPQQCGFFLGAGQGYAQVFVFRVRGAWSGGGYRAQQVLLHLVLAQGDAFDAVETVRLFAFWQQLDGAHAVAAQLEQHVEGFGGCGLVPGGQPLPDGRTVGEQVFEVMATT